MGLGGGWIRVVEPKSGLPSVLAFLVGGLISAGLDLGPSGEPFLRLLEGGADDEEEMLGVVMGKVEITGVAIRWTRTE